MKTEKSCDNCIYSIPDWTNECNSEHYCSNQKSEEYGYNAEYLNSCDEWKSIEPNLGNNGSICTKAGSNDEDRTTDDCISRKQAIEAFEPTHYTDWYTPTIIETLETLPSVRPELLACGNGELVKESDGLVNDLVKDCISRRMAIDEIMSLIEEPDDDFNEGVRNSAVVIYQLPSAQPERKKGKWIPSYSNYRLQSDNWYRCDQCRNESQYPTNFCPCCGADMRGEKE